MFASIGILGFIIIIILIFILLGYFGGRNRW